MKGRTGKSGEWINAEMEFRASQSIVGNRLYLLETMGKIIVLEVNRQFKELARSDIEKSVCMKFGNLLMAVSELE